ncbi:MAG: hypothetical protein ACQ9MH_10760 [Nitrospinales bacterium]
MPIIATGNIKPLMILADPVESLTGQLLLNKGVVIKESHINSLKSWGITEVSVESPSSIRSSQKIISVDPEELAKAKFKIKMLFRHANPNHPAMMEMFRLATLNNLKRETARKNIDEARSK